MGNFLHLWGCNCFANMILIPSEVGRWPCQLQIWRSSHSQLGQVAVRVSWLVLWVKIGLPKNGRWISRKVIRRIQATRETESNHIDGCRIPPANTKHHLKNHGVALDLSILGPARGVFNTTEIGLQKLVHLFQSNIATIKLGQLAKVKQEKRFFQKKHIQMHGTIVRHITAY